MSDIVCTSCVIQVPEPKAVVAPYRTGTSERVSLEEVMAAAAEAGLPDSVVLAYMEAGAGSHRQLPDYEFREGIEEVLVDKEKVFDGTEEQALQEGWQENEFGFVCPTCSDTNHSTEDGSAGDDAGALIALAVASSMGGSQGASYLQKNKKRVAEGIVDLVNDEE